ncbi:LamG-like jellyroll fold domain-containing protein [Nonomuraea turcica]|uniref:LamG-like jellyroll fold domain-containing protein n=1 Tax=Nonomuraea sp. G32 TaxID=3067274 RepID=UPI00273B4863|nr:LamG-like jellyroll fold domain-containing protein [Nonomuraea sp. G32]MDP4505321.1 LamG-like jellyroll fold domain-containing protein [Nonomuraea sp. G32]
MGLPVEANTGDPVAPSEEAARGAARQADAPVEILSKRSETREVFANPEGSFTAVEHLRPVRVRQDGGWVKPDLTMVRRSDGTIGPRATVIGLAVSGGGETPLARMSYAGREMAIRWPGRLPQPELRADSAVYPEVLPGIDLVVRADVDGFAHTLVVKNREAAASPALAKLTFGLHAEGLDVRRESDGRLTAQDRAGGGKLFEAPGAIMWDSGVPPTAAKDDLAKGPSPVSQVAELDTAVGGDSLVLTPNLQLINDPDTRFPVYIDPVWKTVKASGWAYVSRAHPGDSYYKFGGSSTAGVGLCEADSACEPSDVKRIFYRMLTSAYAGKHIISATFIAKETWAYSCADRSVQLWRTKGFVEGSTWNSTADNWVDHLDSRDVAKGWSSSCPAGDVEFNAVDAVRQAAAGSWSTTTFGLKAANEDDRYAWKRFADDAWLRVEYNNPPPQPKQSNLTMSPGGKCVASSPPAVRVPPTLYAVLHDPDSESAAKVTAEFRLGWDGEVQWTKQVGPKTTGSTFYVTVPSTIPQNKTISWAVRTWDGYQWSPWSHAGEQTACYFTYDKSVPAAPVLSSTAYPESDPDNEADPWIDGVGRYGRFTADSASGDVVKYWFGINGNPTQAIERRPSSTGGAVTLDVAPDHAGLNYVTVQAFDTAGNVSEIGRYAFRVKAGAPAKAQWTLDEPVESTQVVAAGGAYPATVNDGVTLGVDGISKTAMQLNGSTGYAATTGAVVNTSQSFAVSAWARLPEDKPAHSGIVVSQTGVTRPSFELIYSPTHDRWIFTRYSADNADATVVRATGTASPDGGEWAHLVCVYDGIAKHIKLYVNGKLQDTTAFTTPWHPTGHPLYIGTGAWDGTPRSFFPGEIDDVRIFDRLLMPEEVGDLFTQHPVIKARWKLNDSAAAVRQSTAYWKLDEAAGATRAEEVNGTYPAGKVGAITFGATGKIGKAVRPDGSTGYLKTAGPVLDTSQSFTVSAWAKLPATKPASTSVITTQAGSQRNAFELSYSVPYNRWVFGRFSNDTTSAQIVRAQSSSVPQPNTWTHLTGVYNAATKQIKLYVNGKLNQTTSFTTAWNATGPLLIGAGAWGSAVRAFFPGDIDDVRVFNQAITDSEIASLATGAPQSVSADDAALGRHVTLYGNALIDQGAGWVGTPPGGLVLDGNGDYAATDMPAVRTDDSFTIAGWVTTAGRPAKPVTIFSQEGEVNSAFTLRYRPDAADPVSAGGYQIEIPDKDAIGAAKPTAEHSAFQSGFSWDHVAIVYDAFQDEMRLYVNGELEQTEEKVSWRFNVKGFNATKAFHLGRTRSDGVWGEYWPGVIDDVWAFQGVASQEQIQMLAGGAELDTGTAS